MLVSAISATQNLIVRPVNYGFINSRGGDSSTDSLVNNFAAPKKKAISENQDTFESINEWKAFCHKQIAGGKLNIIA